MKANLIMSYQRNIKEDDMAFLVKVVFEKDYDAIMEFFNVGWESPYYIDVDFIDDRGCKVEFSDK